MEQKLELSEKSIEELVTLAELNVFIEYIVDKTSNREGKSKYLVQFSDMPNPPGGRHWDVSVFPTKLARDEKAKSKEIVKDLKKQKQIEEDSEKVERVLKEVGPMTKTGIRERAVLNSSRLAAAIERLSNEEKIVFCDVRGGNNQMYKGYALSETEPDIGDIMSDGIIRDD